MIYHELLQHAIQAALTASKEIMEVYGEPIEVFSKADSSPLTEADKRAHRVIEKALSLTQLPILSEEGKDIDYAIRRNWKRFWMVDPLDGTKEFIKRNGEFTVNIALIEDSYPVLGVIYVPVKQILYFGGSAIDASYRLDSEITESFDVEKLMSLSNEMPLKEVEHSSLIKVVGSRSHMSVETLDFVEDIKSRGKEVEMLSMGSSLKICLVAEGSADVYPRFAPTMEWDTAAGQAIVEGAGAEFLDWETKARKTYNNKSLLNNWFLVKGDYE